MYEEYILRIFLAALVGGVIGLEREYRDKSAGFRTMILIATGSAFFTILSGIIGTPIDDTARIAAAVVSGVGFLGAGVIIKDGVHIRGLTTAASIWLVASLGMGMGAGLYSIVFTVTLGIMFVLWILPPFERKIDALHEFFTYHITIKNTDTEEDKVLELFASVGVKVIQVHRSRVNTKERQLTVVAKTTPAKRATLGKCLANAKWVLEFRE
ncbi:MAG: MgtC/SapB family protein [Candidatus Pacebacteria bacterium]|nr:MgtC/SapB family protein [Candidatus Paceibacterota bacterium]